MATQVDPHATHRKLIVALLCLISSLFSAVIGEPAPGNVARPESASSAARTASRRRDQDATLIIMHSGKISSSVAGIPVFTGLTWTEAQQARALRIASNAHAVRCVEPTELIVPRAVPTKFLHLHGGFFHEFTPFMTPN